MKTYGRINEYFYSGKSFSLKITACNDAIASIDFISPGKGRAGELPLNIKILFSWLDLYSAKKTDPSFRIIFSGTGETVSHALDKDEKRINLDLSGYTENEVRVYRELVKVAPGKTISYGTLAGKSGIERGARFAGNVMAKNRFPVIIPCHRVIKGDGSMGNYSGGVSIKRMLLDHERDGFSPVKSSGQGKYCDK